MRAAESSPVAPTETGRSWLGRNSRVHSTAAGSGPARAVAEAQVAAVECTAA